MAAGDVAVQVRLKHIRIERSRQFADVYLAFGVSPRQQRPSAHLSGNSAKNRSAGT
jgi:hypothetical protein